MYVSAESLDKTQHRIAVYFQGVYILQILKLLRLIFKKMMKNHTQILYLYRIMTSPVQFL